MRLNAAWWWIDRWRKSTAFTDMTAEQQGIYRNLLDEIWLRSDHAIPDDPRILAKVSGDPEAWGRCGAIVLKWMEKIDRGWTHHTALEVIRQSQLRSDRQQRYRDRIDNDNRNAERNAGRNDLRNDSVTNSVSPSPSPSPDQSLSPDQNKNKNKRLRTVAAKNGSNGHDAVNRKLLIKFVHEVADSELSYGDIKEAVKVLCKKRRVHFTGEAIGSAIDAVNALNVKAAVRRVQR